MVPGIGGGGTEVSGAPAAGRGAPCAALASASARRIAPRACVSGGSSTGPRRPQAPRLAATSASARTAKGRRVRSGNAGVTAIRPRGEPAHYSDEAKKGEGAGVTPLGFFSGEGETGSRAYALSLRGPQGWMLAVIAPTQLQWTRRSKAPN
jgi:hypothetical protein